MKTVNKEKQKMQVPEEIKELIEETTRKVIAEATVSLANEIIELRKEIKELRVDFNILKEGRDI